MCEALPLKKLSFRFKKSEYGWEGIASAYTIHIGRNTSHHHGTEYYWWDIERKGFGQIAESDTAGYKTNATTFKAAKWRALVTLNKYRNLQQ